MNQVVDYCGKSIVSHEMCLLPPLPNSIVIKNCKPRGTIKYIDSGLIIVEGIFTKKIYYNNKEIISEYVPYKVIINDSRICDLNKNNYIVEFIEVKGVYTKFGGYDQNRRVYYKLMQKNLVNVRVGYYTCSDISWATDFKLY